MWGRNSTKCSRRITTPHPTLIQRQPIYIKVGSGVVILLLHYLYISGGRILGKVFSFCTAFCTVSALVSLSQTGFASACVAWGFFDERGSPSYQNCSRITTPHPTLIYRQPVYIEVGCGVVILLNAVVELRPHTQL